MIEGKYWCLNDCRQLSSYDKGRLPWNWDVRRSRSDREMFPHQVAGSRYLQDHNGGALFMGMRTGKSLTLVDAVIQMGVFPLLIICPMSVMATWRSEFLAEGLTEDEICLAHSGRGREARIMSPHSLVTVVNFEALHATHAARLRHNLPPSLGVPDWAGIVVDESYRIANPESQTTRELLKWPPSEGQFRAVLSGAPASESGLNLVPQFLFLEGKFFGTKSVTEYYRKYCRYDNATYRWYPKLPSHLNDIREEVHKKAYCVQMSDLNLGVEKLYQIWDVEPTVEQKMALSWCVMANTYPGKDKDGKDVTRLMEPLVRSTFTSKAAAGVHPLTNAVIGKGKAEMIRDWLKDNPEEYVLVLSRFTIPLRACYDVLAKAGISVQCITGNTPLDERETYRKKFQEGQVRVILGQIKTVKMGLDFSRASTIFYLSNSYSQDDRTQSEDRGNHTKKTGTLQIIDLCTMGSNDRKLVSLLRQKKKLSTSYIIETLSIWAWEQERKTTEIV